jgi:hypothetical protein
MKCPDEGTLRAYLDIELPEAGLRDTAAHLEACAACRHRLAAVEATMGRVNAWLDAVAPEDLPALDSVAPRIAPRKAGVHWRWAAVALAASLALFMATAGFLKKKEVPVQKPQTTLADTRGPVSPAPYLNPAPYRATAVRKRLHRPKPRPASDDFVAFDDADPIQIGVVVRVMLPVSDASITGGAQEVLADLIIGEDGRARAFRLVK